MLIDRYCVHTVYIHTKNIVPKECHEQMRVISQQAGDHVKLHGKENDFLERVASSTYFAPIHGKLEQLLNPAGFVGRAPQQVREPAQSKYRDNSKGLIHMYFFF